MLKRIALFLVTNILIIVTISFILQLLGVRPYLTQYGLDYQQLAVFCLVWGMTGSLISLGLSRFMAKMMMGVKVIDPKNPGEYRELYSMMEGIARAAHIPMPEVGVYESPEVNAFATGPTKNRALVAFSSGILRSMSRAELEGVAAHEVAHIKNGDMVTMTLLQGVINAFVMFLARVIAFGISAARGGGRDDSESVAAPNMFLVIALEIVLSLLGSMVVMAFSRYREFKADAGSAGLVGRDKMIAALKSLQARVALANVGEPHASLQTMKISGGSSLVKLFSSHPPIEERIRALEEMRH